MVLSRISAPVIYDASGRAMSSRFSMVGGDYEAASNNRERTLYRGWNYERPRPESEMLPMYDRLRIIAYLRKSVRNNPIMAALAFRYALAVGSPTIHAMGPDGGFNDEKERALERRLSRIMYRTGWGWHRLNKVISVETLLAGEVFSVEVEDKVQLIPSELCGSPAKPVANEYDGIGYDAETGAPAYYRFGVRKVSAPGSNYTTISFEEADGAQLVPAEFVYHHGSPSRIEELRYSPPLSSVIDRIQSLNDIVTATVTTFKNQASLSFFFTKNFDPALFAENAAIASQVESNAGAILEQVVARSTPEERIENGQIRYGEVGEDVRLLEPMLKAQNYNEFCLSLLDQICAPIGMFPEEVLIGYRNSNYSSARADRNRLKDVLKDVRLDRAPFIDRVIERQTGIAVDSGELQVASDGIADVTYQWPVVSEIDETKTVAAQTAAMANGSKSLQMVCAENGAYADQVQAQVVREAVYKAKLIKAYTTIPNPTKAQIEAQVVAPAEVLAHLPNAATAAEAINAIADAEAAETNADANTTRAVADSIAKVGAAGKAVGAPAPQAAKPALIESIGISGTQALVTIIQQVSTGVIPRAQGIATIVLLFGITEAEASKLVPEQASAEVVPGAEAAPAVAVA